MELNPDHGVTQELHDNWHKLMALLMQKQGLTKVTITSADVEALASLPEMPTIVAHPHGDEIDIYLMPLSEAKAFVAEHGEVLV